MNAHSTFYPSSLPKSSSSHSFSRPGHTRTNTTVKARPTLSVLTSTNPNTFDGKPRHQKTNSGVATNTSFSTLQTIHDNSSSNGTRHSKTPSTFSRKLLTHCNTLDERVKGDQMGILDLTSVQVYKTELPSGSTEDTSAGSFLRFNKTLTTRREKSKDFIKEFDGRAPVRKHTKTISAVPSVPLVPLDLKALAREAQSRFEKNSRGLEMEVRQYIQKIHLLDLADSRKMKMGGLNIERRELAVTSREYACNVAGLTQEEKERIRALEIDDRDFFKNMETILMEGLKRLERLERLSKEVELQEGVWTRMDADRMEWRYCFVDLRGKAPPIKLSVRTRKEVKFLKIFGSKQHKKPNKFNCEYEFENKRVVKIYEKDRRADLFEQPFFYFAISPDESGFLSVNVEFGDMENEIKLLEMGEKGLEQTKGLMSTRSIYNYSESDDIQRDVREIRGRIRLNNLKLSGGVNIIEENKNLDQYTPERYSQRIGERKIKLDELVRSALMRKIHIQKQKRERSLALYLRRDVQRCFRTIMSENDRKKLELLLVRKSWFFCVALYQVAWRMARILKEYKEAEKEKKKQVLVVTSLMQKVRSRQKSKGNEIEDRMMLDIRLALQFHSRLLKGDGTIEAELKLTSFCEDLREVCQIRDKAELMVETVKTVQKAWREYLRKREGFRDLLARLWDKHYEDVFQKLLRGEHHHNLVRIPNARDLFKKLVPQELKKNDFIRDRFTDSYLDVCIERYRKNYDAYDEQKKERKNEKAIPSLADIVKALPVLSALGTRKRKESKIPSRTRVSIMADIEQFSSKEHNSSKDNSPTEPHSLVLTEPPRLFLLPKKDELEELLGKAIINQVMATLPRGSVVLIPKPYPTH